ncbi:phasin family protein [Pseudoroseomonas globiformis]|uniref:Phasin family protein n=1 Tax=Teichococcus globiformis TaxID=2307229 RepID=A0ABV7G1W7_9PROT
MATAPRTARLRPGPVMAKPDETMPVETAPSSVATVSPALHETSDSGVAGGPPAMESKMDQATRTVDGFNKAAEEAMEFGRGNLEAFTKATQTYMSGMQELSRQAFAVMQGLNEQALQNARAMTSVKSLKEAAEMQVTFTKAQLERSMTEATKFNEAAFKLAEQSSAPIAARMTLAVERLARPAPLN